MLIGGSIIKSTIHSCYDLYLNFIMALKMVQIKNLTVRTHPLNHFRSDKHRNYNFPHVWYFVFQLLTMTIQLKRVFFI
jgi:hypothetical protein